MYDRLFLAILGTSSVHDDASRKRYMKYGLTDGYPKIFYLLRCEEGVIQKQLADSCGVKQSTLTVILKKMEANNWIRRERGFSSTGKAVYRVFLTDEGRALSDKLDADADELENLAFSGFTSDEKDMLLSMLSRISDNMRNS